MGRLKRVSVALVMLLVALVVLIFMLENQQAVSLLFLGWTGPQLPVSVIALVALLIGMIIGPLLGWLFGAISRSRRKQLA